MYSRERERERERGGVFCEAIYRSDSKQKQPFEKWLSADEISIIMCQKYATHYNKMLTHRRFNGRNVCVCVYIEREGVQYRFN